jgi:hypothetical protein
VDAGDSSDEVAIGDVGESGQVCLIGAFIGDVTTSADIPSNFLVFWVGRVAYFMSFVITNCIAWMLRSETYGSQCPPSSTQRDLRQHRSEL